ncbi:PKD domain-containing protein [Alteromonas halophila]|uniref:PKD/Chitinase domain-containing protein n=1 Tax=Alteromonas halophila TaxID=516698 RepID=A0A918MWS7_9ALTE|nr:PKD domain-containing protein [Alteromonas halophila]GGW81690.1 hypothetical protein GCM10007391_13640 [Alteromonas halophila]
MKKHAVLSARRSLIALALASVLTACGGSDDNDVTTTPQPEPQPSNEAPVAEIVAPATLSERDSAVFDGSSSSDTDGSIDSYDWSLDVGDYAGGAITMTRDGATAELFAGEIAESVTVTITLSVTDDDGETTESSVTVTIDEIDAARLPAMPATPDNTVNGEDADDDGVRDDIEIAIYERFPLDTHKREVSRRAASVYQQMLEVGLNGSDIEVTDVAEDVVKMVRCYNLENAFSAEDARKERKLLRALMLNTEERRAAAQAFDQKMSGRVQRSLPVTSNYCRLEQN